MQAHGTMVYMREGILEKFSFKNGKQYGIKTSDKCEAPRLFEVDGVKEDEDIP